MCRWVSGSAGAGASAYRVIKKSYARISMKFSESIAHEMRTNRLHFDHPQIGDDPGRTNFGQLSMLILFVLGLLSRC